MPSAASGDRCRAAFRALDELRKRSGSLTKRRCPAAAAHRQSCHARKATAEASGRCRISAAAAMRFAAHLGEIGIGRPVGIVMQIMEFPDRRETSLEHLHIG